MARISISDTHLRVDLEGLHPLWALRRRVVVPLAHVRGATADPGVVAEPTGLRAPGLRIPGLATIGTFHRQGERCFWDVSTGARAVVIRLRDEHYAALVLEVAAPRAVVEAVNAASTRAVAPIPARAEGAADTRFRAVLAEPTRPPRRRLGPGPRWGTVIAVGAVVEAAMKAAVLVDVRRRAPQDLRGSKRTWRLLAFVDLVGPLAYVSLGRRPVSPADPASGA